MGATTIIEIDGYTIINNTPNLNPKEKEQQLQETAGKLLSYFSNKE